MRILEIIFISLGFLSLIALLLKKGFSSFWTRTLALLALVAGLCQVWVEGYRWQMIPAYALVALLAVHLVRDILHARRLSPLWSLFGMLWLISAVVLGSVLPVFSLPLPDGPFSIGTVTREWSRATLPEEAGEDSAASRKMVVQFWYPARPGQGGKAAPYRTSNDGSALMRHLSLVKTHSRIDVPLANTPGSYPVVVFSPIWNSGPSSYASLIETLASHGYVVAAIHHPVDSSEDFSEISSPQKVHEKNLEIRRRANDARFLLDQLKKMNDGDPKNPMTGRLDLSRVGIFGHSFGGAAAAEACWLDPRFKAAINMDGAMYWEAANERATQPFFFMYNDFLPATDAQLHSPDPGKRYDTQYGVLDLQRKEDWLKLHSGYSLMIRGSLHANFSDRPLYSPLKRLTAAGIIDPRRALQIANAYILAYFEKHLRGQQEPLLDGPSSQYPEASFKVYAAPPAAPAGPSR